MGDGRPTAPSGGNLAPSSNPATRVGGLVGTGCLGNRSEARMEEVPAVALAAQVSSSQRALQQEQEEVLQGASHQSPEVGGFKEGAHWLYKAQFAWPECCRP